MPKEHLAGSESEDEKESQIWHSERSGENKNSMLSIREDEERVHR